MGAFAFGGGEPRSKKVENESDFLTNLPRTEVAVPNPTYKVFVIGRRVLNYCGGFGVEDLLEYDSGEVEGND